MNAQRSPFPGNIDFHAQHSPVGAFMSFTCGHFANHGGIGLEIGKPAQQNLYIGVKRGDRKAIAPIRCLPFFKPAVAAVENAAANFSVEQNPLPAPAPSFESYAKNQIQRHYGWASDSWTTPDFTFSVYSPFSAIPQPGTDPRGLRAALLPAIIATLEIDNRAGTETMTAVFGIDFIEPGTRILGGEADASGKKNLGFAWRRTMGVLGAVENDDANAHAPDKLFALQRWSIAEGLSDVTNPIHALGTCGGLALEVPAGAKQTLVLAIGAYLDGIVTTGLEGRYFYTRFYSNLEEVLNTALVRSADLREKSARLDASLKKSGLSLDQQFLIAHGTRSYYGSTQLLDVGGEPFWIVNEGEYCMMNTLDLSVDQAFWELKHNPWVVANILTNFVRRYSYHDEVKTRGGQLQPGGVSFAHDMGVNNNFSPSGTSSYELSHRGGCFSYMTQEQLCNWILTAACYVLSTRDTKWLTENAALITAIAESMRARANPRTGLMAYDSALCADGQEITTYDSLDESLGQARANTYLAAKCWASWLALDMFSRILASSGDGQAAIGTSMADDLARFLTSCVVDETIPAVLEKENPGYQSRIIPAIESLIYPAYWLTCLAKWPAASAAGLQEMLQNSLQGPFIDALRRHTVRLLTDPQTQNLFPDGGLKLSSTSNNSWMSKIAIAQYVARLVLRLHESDPAIAEIFRRADSAHVKWQTDGSAYWACSDQFVNGEAKGSRYYPRIITAALWMDEQDHSQLMQLHAKKPQVTATTNVAKKQAATGSH